MALQQVYPDREKAKSVFKMVVHSLEMVKTIDQDKFPSKALTEFYNIIRQLVEIQLLIRGYKARGDEAHEESLRFAENSGILTLTEFLLSDELRKNRNRIEYDGFFIDADYLARKKKEINSLIDKLSIATKKELDLK